MKQIKKEDNTVLESHSSILLSIYPDNLEGYSFPEMDFIWEVNSNLTDNLTDEIKFSELFLKNNELIYKLMAFPTYTTIFLILPKEIEKTYLIKKEVKESLEKLNINDEIIWFNEWEFLPRKAQNLNTKISQWINEEKTMQEIKEKTAEITEYNDLEIKNLLTSHCMLAGSDFLRNYYSQI